MKVKLAKELAYFEKVMHAASWVGSSFCIEDTLFIISVPTCSSSHAYLPHVVLVALPTCSVFHLVCASAVTAKAGPRLYLATDTSQHVRWPCR